MTANTDQAYLNPDEFYDYGADPVEEFFRNSLAETMPDGAKLPADTQELLNQDNQPARARSEFLALSEGEQVTTARLLFYAVRDQIRYNPYRIDATPEGFWSSSVVKNGYGFCVNKAMLLVSLARRAGIPARLGYADVRNHISSPRLREIMRTDIFYYHGYTGFLLGDKWLKVTPAFDKKLCEKIGVNAIDFDGHSDAQFQRSNKAGQPFMDYVTDHGFADPFDFDFLFDRFRHYYPRMETMWKRGASKKKEAESEKGGGRFEVTGDFHAEADG